MRVTCPFYNFTPCFPDAHVAHRFCIVSAWKDRSIRFLVFSAAYTAAAASYIATRKTWSFEHSSTPLITKGARRWQHATRKVAPFLSRVFDTDIYDRHAKQKCTYRCRVRASKAAASDGSLVPRGTTGASEGGFITVDEAEIRAEGVESALISVQRIVNLLAFNATKGITPALQVWHASFCPPSSLKVSAATVWGFSSYHLMGVKKIDPSKRTGQNWWSFPCKASSNTLFKCLHWHCCSPAGVSLQIGL